MSRPELTYSWRPGTLVRRLVHCSVDGQTRQPPSLAAPAPWMWAACGQQVMADGKEEPSSVRCPECAAWLRSEGPPNPGA